MSFTYIEKLILKDDTIKVLKEVDRIGMINSSSAYDYITRRGGFKEARYYGLIEEIDIPPGCFFSFKLSLKGKSVLNQYKENKK